MGDGVNDVRPCMWPIRVCLWSALGRSIAAGLPGAADVDAGLDTPLPYLPFVSTLGFAAAGCVGHVLVTLPHIVVTELGKRWFYREAALA